MAAPLYPKKLVIAVHPKFPAALDEAQAVSDYLKEKGLDVPLGSLNDEGLRQRVKNGEFEILIALGGDGTILRAGHLCAPYSVPMLGINMGKFGFLIQIQRDRWREMLPQMLNGNFWIERRMMLRAEMFRAGESRGVWHALNEVSVSRGKYLNPVRLTASVDGSHLATYVADGLLASTATGSTAYALAAGGPILPPDLRNILIVPVAPHLSVDRAVVLAEGASVGITIKSDNVVLSVDGQNPVEMDVDDRVDIRSADYSVQFIRFGDLGYFYRNITAHMNQNPTTDI